MRMAIVEVFNARGKRVRRYTEWFYGPCDIRPENRKAVALERVKAKFGRCWPNCEFRSYNGNQ